jgi:tyrosyl-tRNA synthetase
LTSPLLTTASGAKMGKTAQGAVWLDESMLPIFEYWQYWRNCEDQDTGRFLKLFTELPLDEIARLEALGGTEINEAKKILATEAAAMVHGREAALQAAETARLTFEMGSLAEDLPSVEIGTAEIEAGFGVLAAFVKAGLAASTGEARRQIKGGGLKINDRTVTDERAMIGLANVTEGIVKLSLGKKRHILLKII